MTTPSPVTEEEIDYMLRFLDRHAEDEMQEHSRRVRKGFQDAAYIIRQLKAAASPSWQHQMEQRLAAAEQQIRATACTVLGCPPHHILPHSPPSPAFPLPTPDKT